MFFRSTHRHRTTAITSAPTRRESPSRARTNTPSTKPRTAIRSGAKAITASGAASLLLIGYIVPAYADARPGLANSQGQVAASEMQSMKVEGAETGAATVTRDAYSVTKPLPKRVSKASTANAYSRISDDFANNPNNLIIQWPFSQGVPISSGFGPRVSPCRGCSSFHDGLDLVPGSGTPIQIIADGVVSKVGNPDGTFGVHAVVDHVIDGQKVSSLYAHMLNGSLAVAVGDQVKKGQIVGNVGSTGASSGPHLHLGIYLDGTLPVDPFAWLKQKVGS